VPDQGAASKLFRLPLANEASRSFKDNDCLKRRLCCMVLFLTISGVRQRSEWQPPHDQVPTIHNIGTEQDIGTEQAEQSSARSFSVPLIGGRHTLGAGVPDRIHYLASATASERPRRRLRSGDVEGARGRSGPSPNRAPRVTPAFGSVVRNAYVSLHASLIR
jgi:hypothetical protein